MTEIKRTQLWEKHLDDPSYTKKKPIEVVIEANANLIGSKVKYTGLGKEFGKTELHAPVLDIDFPAQLLPSSTKGHHHLYLDKPLTWRQYKRLLKALMKAGIIEKGYYKASLANGQTSVRKPDVRKKTDNPNPDLTPIQIIRLREIKDSFDKLADQIDPKPQTKPDTTEISF